MQLYMVIRLYQLYGIKECHGLACISGRGSTLKLAPSTNYLIGITRDMVVRLYQLYSLGHDMAVSVSAVE
eukprot:Awhi_evm1s5575